jgi:hypothetical protein
MGGGSDARGGAPAIPSKTAGNTGEQSKEVVMRGIAKRLSGPIVVIALISACGESDATGSFVPVPAPISFGSESPNLRVMLAHEFAAAAVTTSDVAADSVAAYGYDTTRKAIAHELEDDGGPRRSGRSVIDLPVR